MLDQVALYRPWDSNTAKHFNPVWFYTPNCISIDYCLLVQQTNIDKSWLERSRSELPDGNGQTDRRTYFLGSLLIDTTPSFHSIAFICIDLPRNPRKQPDIENWWKETLDSWARVDWHNGNNACIDLTLTDCFLMLFTSRCHDPQWRTYRGLDRDAF